MAKKPHIETQALHGGNTVDDTMARAIPIYRTSSYLFRDTEHAASLFALRKQGNVYTRLMNPTQDVLENRVSALEGGAGALALASGSSAIYYSIINICSHGDEVVSANNLYGGTYTLFDCLLPGFGIKVRFANPNDLDAVERAITGRTRALFTEVIGNPVLDVANLKGLSRIAKENHLPLVVDSTFTTPYLIRPIEHGADVVVHSLTKWMGGHGTGIGGIAVDGGRFDWTDHKFALYNEPDSSYHGIRFAHDLEGLPAFAARMRFVLLRNLGACISPDNAWLFLQGLETLPLRMQRHCDNAMLVAEHLQAHRRVAWIRYPGLKDDPSHMNAAAQFENGFGGMLVFGIKGGSGKGARFIEGLKLFSHVANVGDAKSLAIHPWSTTHSQLSDKQRLESGITPDLVRLSIGIEHIEDIIEDIDLALKGTG